MIIGTDIKPTEEQDLGLMIRPSVNRVYLDQKEKRICYILDAFIVEEEAKSGEWIQYVRIGEAGIRRLIHVKDFNKKGKNGNRRFKEIKLDYATLQAQSER